MILADPIGNVDQTSSLYSQIAGVLAGFAFTALLTYLARSAPDMDGDAVVQDKERGTIASVLFSTLAALIICSALYSVLAGGVAGSGNSESGLLLFNPAFSLAVFSMFYATGLAALPYDHMKAMLGLVRLLVCVAGPALSMSLIAGGAYDICVSGAGRCLNAPALSLVHPFGFGLALAVLITGASWAILHRYGSVPIDAEKRRSMAAGVTWIVLTTAFTASVFAVVLDVKPVTFVVSHWGIYAVEAITAALMQTFAVLGAHSLRPRKEKEKATENQPDAAVPSPSPATG